MSDKALSGAELELTQRFQTHFPHGEVPIETLRRWNSKPKEEISAFLKHALQREPRESDFEGTLLTLWGLYTPPAAHPIAEFFFPDFIKKLKEKDPRASILMDHNFEEWFLDYREIFDVGERQVLLVYRVNRPYPIGGELSGKLGGRQYIHCALRHVAYIASNMVQDGKTYVFRVFDRERILRIVRVSVYQNDTEYGRRYVSVSAATFEGNKECFRPGDFVVTMMIPD